MAEDFYLLLQSHLDAGTGRSAWLRRHGGRVQEVRSYWPRGKFAEACAINERTLRGWLSGRKIPKSTMPIEMVLFDSQPCRAERQELRQSLNRSRERRELRRAAAPHIIMYGTNLRDPALIPKEVWKLYENLFPEIRVRDDPETIIGWLKAAFLYPEKNWVQVFSTIELAGSCVGLGFVTTSRKTGLGWWSYLGMAQGERSQHYVTKLIERVIITCERLVPNATAILFGVEQFSKIAIASALSKLEGVNDSEECVPDFTEEERLSIYAAQRLAFFTLQGLGGGVFRPKQYSISSEEGIHRPYGALAITAGKGKAPISYIQPALREPLDKSNEIYLWLMLYPFRGMLKTLRQSQVGTGDYEISKEQIHEILSFIYDELFPACYEESYEDTMDALSYIPGYGQYVREVRARAFDEIVQGQLLLVGSNLVPKEARRILTRFSLE